MQVNNVEVFRSSHPALCFGHLVGDTRISWQHGALDIGE